MQPLNLEPQNPWLRCGGLSELQFVGSRYGEYRRGKNVDSLGVKQTPAHLNPLNTEDPDTTPTINPVSPGGPNSPNRVKDARGLTMS